MAGKCYFLNCHHLKDEIIAVRSGCWGQFTQAIKMVSHPSPDIIGSRLVWFFFPQMCRCVCASPSSLVRIRFKTEGVKRADEIHIAAFIRGNSGSKWMNSFPPADTL